MTEMGALMKEYFNKKSKVTVLPVQQFLKCFNRDVILSAPIKIEIAITNSCNQNCSHCSNANSIAHDINQNISFEWINDVISCNPFYCVITGGEPLLHPQFLDIIKLIKSKGIIVKILSNGTLWNKDIALKLKEIGFTNNDCIQISLDADNEYDYILRRGNNFFRQVVNNIKLLSEEKLSVEVHYVPTRNTIEQVEKVYKIANENGAMYFSTATLAPLGRAIYLNEVDAIKLVEREIRLIEMSKQMNTSYLGSLLGENCTYMHLIQDFSDVRLSRPNKSKTYRCAAGTSMAYIKENGEVYSCVYATEAPFKPMGNLERLCFTHIWKQVIKEGYWLGLDVSGTECENCSMWGVCTGGCLGISSSSIGFIKAGHDTRCKKIKENYYYGKNQREV